MLNVPRFYSWATRDEGERDVYRVRIKKYADNDLTDRLNPVETCQIWLFAATGDTFVRAVFSVAISINQHHI